MSAKKRSIISTVSLALCTAMLLTACDSSEKSSNQSDTNSSQTDSSISSASEPENSSVSDSSGTSEPGGFLTASELPRMDGSTSASPLEIGLKSGFLGISYNDAKELVSHTTTHDSFKRLIADEVDLILSVPISAEQQAAADEAGVKLTMEPVAREGFVFVVNASNPVSSLTQEQLRKIYSGEITNWKELGGNDEPILPYQRNTDSGSQNYMTVFMEGYNLIEPKSDLVAVGMGGLMDAVAVYDNSAGAIGYSVYSYAAQMYANANKVKFIAIDGIEPSKATMADESYPLMSCTYAIYTDRSAESAKKFTEKMLSDEGQMYVLESGYLPVNGMEVPSKYLPYEAVGTGEPRPAGFVIPNKSSEFHFTDKSYRETVVDGVTVFELQFLKNTELQARINSDINDALNRMRKYEVPKTGDKYCITRIDGIGIELSARNGYLFILIGCDDPDHYGYMSGVNSFFCAETLCYDLVSGKKLEELSDLFWKDEDFMPEVNKSISEFINGEIMLDIDPEDPFIEQKLDFSGLLGEQKLFTRTRVGFKPDNIYFTTAPFLEFSTDNSVTQYYRDMSELVLDDLKENAPTYEFPPSEWETKNVRIDGEVYLQYTGSYSHTEAEVKAHDELYRELQKKAWDHFRSGDPEYKSSGEVNIHVNEDRWKNCISIGHRAFSADMDIRVNLDIDSHEIITMETLLGKDWEQYCKPPAGYIAEFLSENNLTISDLGVYPSIWLYSEGEDEVTIYAYPTKAQFNPWNDIFFSVPKDKVNSRYL